MSAGRKSKRRVYTALNKVKLVRGGKPYFDCLLEMIAAARESIHLQMYIYSDDETGKMVANSLKEAVKRNVQVYLLADGYASRTLSRSLIGDLQAAGIHFRFFDPLFKSRHFYFGRRLHHKIVVVDAVYALVGGINIADRYNDMPGERAWLDFALYIHGEASKQLCVLCWKIWNNFPQHLGTTPCEQRQASFSFNPAEITGVGMRRNDWVRRRNEISTSYVDMFRTAHSHITVLCSYFLPGSIIRRQLSAATKRGVRIKVITAGISDVPLAKYAERYMYDWLLRNGIELYEYQSAVLHAKIAVCDGEWMTVGSYNINNVSAYASIELNMNVLGSELAKETEKTIQQIIANDCIQITKESQVRSKTLLRQFTQWLSYELIRISLYLGTFYFKHKY